MRSPFIVSILLLFSAAALGLHAHATHPATSPWKLSWSDEFNGPDGSAPDTKKWTYDLGGKGWGNQELETYTNRTANAEIEHGNLVITARKENFTGSDGVAREYTSARLKTQDLFAQRYGRFEARIKIPRGQGMWSAFWLLGQDIATVDWPQCGEIDIMENIGKEPGIVHGSLHGPGSTSGTSDLTSAYVLPVGQNYADAFHVYAVEWDPETIRFFVDATNYVTFTKSQWQPGSKWVFDHPFFMILNLAVGGNWPGSPDATTQLPRQMLVDYVRVYTKVQ